MSKEQQLIKKMQNMFNSAKALEKFSSANIAMGDDTAFIEKNFFLQNDFANTKGLLLTTDSLVEEIHFRWDISTPAEVAKKLVEMNVSDIYCKGGTPLFALLNFSITATTLEKRMSAFLSSLKRIMQLHGFIILGGDTTSSKKDVFSLTLIGSSGSSFIPRKNPNIGKGDIVVISGSPGWSEFALDMLLAGKKISTNIKKKYTTPSAQRHAPSWLFPLQTLVSIDQSDSLYQSLQILSQENKMELWVDIEKIPQIKKLKKMDANYIHHVLNGGEDFSVIAIIPASQKELAIQIKDQQKDFALIGEVVRLTQNYSVSFFEGNQKIHLPLKHSFAFEHF